MGDNTVLVLSNDNGGWCGYGGLNHPYRGHKTTLVGGWCARPRLYPCRQEG